MNRRQPIETEAVLAYEKVEHAWLERRDQSPPVTEAEEEEWLSKLDDLWWDLDDDDMWSVERRSALRKTPEERETIRQKYRGYYENLDVEPHVPDWLEEEAP